MSAAICTRRARRLVAGLLAFATWLAAVAPALASMVGPRGENIDLVQPICASVGLAESGPSAPAPSSPPSHRHSDACPLCAACAGCAPGPRSWPAAFIVFVNDEPATVVARPVPPSTPRIAAQPRAPPRRT